jgi:threonine/homoserine/homoserine lactone efflux protein
MIDWSALFSIAVLFMLGVMSPGPNFLIVAQFALTRGRAEAFAAICGVAIISTLWAGASLFGLAVLFKLFPWMQVALRLAGAAYLVWSGIRLWRKASQPAPEVPRGAPDRARLADAFRAGLATNLSNAKAITFYSSAFAAVAPAPDKPATLYVVLLLVICLVFFWYGTVALVLTTGPLARGYRRGRVWIERISGVLMIGFGVRLAIGD